MTSLFAHGTPGGSMPPALRHVGFLTFLVASFVLFWEPLTNLFRLSLNDERYSYIVVIPFTSVCLIYLERRRIFLESRYSLRLGILLLSGLAALYCLLGWRAIPISYNDRLSLLVFAIILMWIAGFILSYGTRPLSAAVFPLCWLLLMIPIPSAVIEKLSFALQQSSAEITSVLFRLAGVPVLRRAFTFSLPGFDIEIAAQCSGIRSSLTFVIAAVLAGHVLLRSSWSKVCLGLLTVPIVIFKNALRIFTITWLGLHVSPTFLQGRLHLYSGISFSLVALAILLPVLLFLQKAEGRSSRTAISE